MRFGIFFSLLLSCSAFAVANPTGDLPKAKVFKCKIDRKKMVLAGLKLADHYVELLHTNPQFEEITVIPGVELNRLAETEFFDYTLVVPISIELKQRPGEPKYPKVFAKVVSVYPSDEYGHGTAYEDFVVPFSIEETGPKSKCGFRLGFESAAAAEKPYLSPTFKVMSIEETPIILDDKKTLQVSE